MLNLKTVLASSIFLLAICKRTLSFDVEGKILWNNICKDISDLGQAKVILNEGTLYGNVQSDGSFVIPDITAGSHILSVISHDFNFDNIFINISESSPQPDVWQYIPGTRQALRPTSDNMLPYPIILSPRSKNNYFTERESFDIFGMLRNPMMLMMIGTGALMLGMPYLMKNLDPEVAREVRERQARVANLQNSMQSGDIRGGLSSLLAAAAEDSGTSQSSVKKAAPNQVGRNRANVGPKNKRR